MIDQLATGHRIRVLTIMDVFSRESLTLHVGQSVKGYDVVRVLDQLIRTRGKPKRIQVDNGGEFTCRVMDRWVCFNKVELDFNRPDKPIDDPFIESFDGKFREECLNQNWFLSLSDARAKISSIIIRYKRFLKIDV